MSHPRENVRSHRSVKKYWPKLGPSIFSTDIGGFIVRVFNIGTIIQQFFYWTMYQWNDTLFRWKWIQHPNNPRQSELTLVRANLTRVTSPPNPTTGGSRLICTLLLFIFDLLPSPVHHTGFSLGFFPGFPAIFTLLSSQQHVENTWETVFF